MRCHRGWNQAEQVASRFKPKAGVSSDLHCVVCFSGDPTALVAALRQDILSATGCTASAGIGPNLLVARLATRKAKPNGALNRS